MYIYLKHGQLLLLLLLYSSNANEIQLLSKRKRYDITYVLTHNTSTHTVIIRTHTHQEEQVGIYTLIQITRKSYMHTHAHTGRKKDQRKKTSYTSI